MRPSPLTFWNPLKAFPRDAHGHNRVSVCSQSARAFQGEQLQLIKDIVAGKELKTLPHRSAISGINYSPKSGHTVGSDLKKHALLFQIFYFRDERGLSWRAIFFGSRHNSRRNWRVSRELLNVVLAGIHEAYFSLFCFHVQFCLGSCRQRSHFLKKLRSNRGFSRIWWSC